MTDALVVKIEHIRSAGLCSRGARIWFNRNGLDYAHFLKHGYPLATIQAIGDPLAKKVVERTLAEAAGED